MICAILFEEQCQYQELRSYRQDKSFLNCMNILLAVYQSFISSYREKILYGCIITLPIPLHFGIRNQKENSEC